MSIGTKHRQKQRYARSLMSEKEIRNNVPIFQSKAWIIKSEVIKNRILNQRKKAKK